MPPKRTKFCDFRGIIVYRSGACKLMHLALSERRKGVSVELYVKVRRVVMVEGRSEREVACYFGIHRNTVKKMWRVLLQDPIPIKHASKLAKNFIILFRRSCLCSTVLPWSFTPRIWNISFAESIPIVEIFMRTLLSVLVIIEPLFWHSDTV